MIFAHRSLTSVYFGEAITEMFLFSKFPGLDVQICLRCRGSHRRLRRSRRIPSLVSFPLLKICACGRGVVTHDFVESIVVMCIEDSLYVVLLSNRRLSCLFYALDWFD